jgi:tRNA modification GTPase
LTRPDTIAAIATAPGRAGVGVVRVSGHSLDSFAQRLTGRTLVPRRAHLTRFLAADGGTIDTGIALLFAAPASYTGEDVLELQAHGGPVVLQLLLKRCLDLGARPAEAGEFTLRAFLNDKLDLAQAEAVADLIEATTAGAARSAVRSLSGDFSSEIRALVEGLVELRMLAESNLDFPDEDVDFLQSANAEMRVVELRAALEGIRKRAKQGSILRRGLHVVLAGKPNVGKSSLLNRLAGDEVAIVTAIPGTTRDAVRRTLDIDGIPVDIIDTAGLRETQDELERLGMARTWSEIARADAVVLMLDAREGIGAAEREILAKLPPGLRRIFVYNKIDLAGATPRREEGTGDSAGAAIFLSAKSGDGVELLRAELRRAAGWEYVGEDVFMARERHLVALERAGGALDRAKANLGALELFAEELRLAQGALSEITGEFSSDDLLGEIFSRFCIGK